MMTPLSNTTILSASRTVDSRWAMTTVDRPTEALFNAFCKHVN